MQNDFNKGVIHGEKVNYLSSGNNNNICTSFCIFQNSKNTRQNFKKYLSNKIF